MGILKNVCLLQCPRCRKGKLFLHPNFLSWKNILAMPETCDNCSLKFEIENGFWWGTGYINYILSVVISALSCVMWYFTFGFNTKDFSIYWWLLCNGMLVTLLQPWIMRIGRSIYIHFFIPYKGLIK